MKPSPYRHIAGMNYRNRHLVFALNPPRAIALANDKIACKQVLIEAGIPTPATIATLHQPGDVDRMLPRLVDSTNGFVVKPARGAQGRAVNIFTRALPDGTLLPMHGAAMSLREFRFLVACIISGEYSAGRPQDSVLVEDRIKPDRDWVFSQLPGAPDMRILVLRGRPIMGMIRVPTLDSDGKANLHRGGVGVGIDLERERTTHAVWKGAPLAHHPDTGEALGDRFVPHLPTCIQISERCAEIVPLGFMGVDIMLDRAGNPQVIELNAHPGLSIQLANRQGLLECLSL